MGDLPEERPDFGCLDIELLTQEETHTTTRLANR
jgi:hypothetical protein